MEPIDTSTSTASSFEQIHAARLQHFCSTDKPIKLTDSQDEQVVFIKSLGTSSMDTGGVIYQRCGGGRRIVRKRIGGN